MFYFKVFNFIFFFLSKFPSNSSASFISKAKVFFLKLNGAKINDGVAIYPYSEVRNPINFSIGTNSGIGLRCVFNCEAQLSIGARVLIGPEVMIFTANHIWCDKDKTFYGKGIVTDDVSIGDDCWLGARSIILPGVSLGKGVTVCAGAIVTKSFPDYSVIAGVPAKIMKFNNV
ncbi:hypothetical protein CXF80_19970 [Shewanella sp. Actino-trap-3]|uniref:acyltransferase n=1 Tax=Shewanella sp. Actino-trap-3 TaxID=2058331 RepID=UPI000C33556A|nr:acyltransferase [Shewanella sp. Actino-trap-3]PKG80385.1 hypothetical protein CXF80_19970 [Shewanella sp. Actino-trap-3]